MYPHERSLVKKFEGRPFAIIGVNSDDDREVLKERMKAEQITWRSFWDGGATYRPLASSIVNVFLSGLVRLISSPISVNTSHGIAAIPTSPTRSACAVTGTVSAYLASSADSRA